ncbi:MAG: hypothetical protein AB9907_14710 [Flexilinea sp.]
MDVLQLVQTTLDDALETDAVRVYWGQRGEIDDDANKQEYIVYTQDSDDVLESADGNVVARTASIAVRLYIDQNRCRSYAGRTAWKTRTDAIISAMESAGFLCAGGWSEIGDVDDVGFSTFLAIFDISRVEST